MNAQLDDNNANGCSTGLRYVVDRIWGDPQNSIGVILNKSKETYIYKIGVMTGVLQGFYSRNQFDLCEQKLFDLADIATDKKKSQNCDTRSMKL